MDAEWWQHFLAAGATLLTAIASFFQARKALAKAEDEKNGLDSTVVESLSFPKELLKAFDPRTHPDNNAEIGTPGFSVKHFWHVATLWFIIVLAAIAAFFAEVIDWNVPG